MDRVHAGPLAGCTLAELQGIEAGEGAALAALADAALEEGRPEVARAALEALVVTNHLDARAWALLSRAHRRLARPLAARFCAEVAARIAPGDREARLAFAESLLACGEERAAARDVLLGLADDGPVGDRARALLSALSG